MFRFFCAKINAIHAKSTTGNNNKIFLNICASVLQLPIKTTNGYAVSKCLYSARFFCDHKIKTLRRLNNNLI